MRNRTLVLLLLIVISAMLVAGCTQPKPVQLPATPQATPVPTTAAPASLTGCEMIKQDKETMTMMKNTNLRNVSFFEVILWCGDGGTYNTLSLNDPKDSAPVDLVKNINTTELATEYQVVAVSTNPDTGRKFWTCDEFDVMQSTTIRDFEGLQTRYSGDTAAGPNGEPLDLSVAGIPAIAYDVMHFYRTSTLIFEKGKPVFLLDDTSGTTWVNKNYQTGVDPTLTIQGMATLDKRLKNLPAGWKFRTVILKEDLIIKANGSQRIMWDELGGAYDALEPGTVNYVP